jgi:hypothetical protein
MYCTALSIEQPYIYTAHMYVCTAYAYLNPACPEKKWVGGGGGRSWIGGENSHEPNMRGLGKLQCTALRAEKITVYFLQHHSLE